MRVTTNFIKGPSEMNGIMSNKDDNNNELSRKTSSDEKSSQSKVSPRKELNLMKMLEFTIEEIEGCKYRS